MLFGTNPIKIAVLLHVLIITVSTIIEMLIPVLIKLTVIIPSPVIVKSLVISSELVMIKTIIISVTPVITTIPITIECYTIIPGSVIIIVHKRSWGTYFK